MGKASRKIVEDMKVPSLQEEIKAKDAEILALQSKLLKYEKEPTVEELAKLFHESGREAVLTNKVLKPDGAPIGQIKFKEWDELPEDAKEDRRIQSRYLLAKCNISLK